MGDRVVLIGASTGGVEAVINVLSSFGRNCPPTAIVQHTGAGFGSSLVDLLNKRCAATVVLANGDIKMKKGVVVVGAGQKRHLVFKDSKRRVLGLEESGVFSGHCPSVDKLFMSADQIAPETTVALLTGMGRDGAEGMKTLHDNGAHTVAQNKETSVVFGMPKAAIEIGAASSVLPLDKIGRELISRSEFSHQR